MISYSTEEMSANVMMIDPCRKAIMREIEKLIEKDYMEKGQGNTYDYVA